ncbi:MAG: flavodoxin family protein [Eubacteriales bacterium]|nr:flavodoxin family protein [Eubacteriales bacterium]
MNKINKILLINGSPKGTKSDTLVVSKAFLEGMDAAYEQVDIIHAKVAPCTGCYSCWFRTPGKCVINDDAEEIVEKMLEADLVIWSMPLYCFGMPAGIKALVERMLPLATPAQKTDADGHTYHENRRQPHAVNMLISGCGFPDYEGNFDALVIQFRKMFGKDAPMILCAEAPMLNIEQARPVTLPYLERVKKAGREFTLDGRISDETAAVLSKPMLDPDIYRKICNGDV